MKEQSKTKRNLTILGLCVLLLVFVLAIILIFAGLESMVVQGPANLTSVTDVATGEESIRYALTIREPAGEEELPPGGVQWLGQCDDEGTHWLSSTTPDRWTGLLYLPQLDLELTNGNVSLLQEKDEEGNLVLTVYLATQGLPQGEADRCLLVFTHKEQGGWPDQIELVVNGEREELDSRCIYNGGQLYWAQDE